MIEHMKILYIKTPIYTNSKITTINGLSSRKRHVLLACPHFAITLHVSFLDKWIRTKDRYRPYSKFKIFRQRKHQYCFCRNYGLNPEIFLSFKTNISLLSKDLFDKISLFDNISFFLSKLKQTISFAHHT